MKVIKVATAAILFLVACATSYADTVTMDFVSVGGNNDGKYYTYPYNFDINGSKTPTQLMCVSFNNEVYLGETWTATRTAINASSLPIYQEDAYLFSMIGVNGYTSNDVQEAVWYLSAGANQNQVSASAADITLANSALGIVNAANAMSGSVPAWDNGEYVLYVPQGNFPNSPGTPQSYLGFAPLTPAPEPSSLALLGTGLVGAAGVLYRRRKITTQPN